jgi:hypothetical protein
MATTAWDLLSLKGNELDKWFERSDSGPPPTGPGAGVALLASGTALGRVLAAVTRAVAWQGNEFATDGASLRNLLSPFSLRGITAAVHERPSLLDGRPCVVLDYSSTSRVAGWIRDEIRPVEPGLYLGVVYLRGRRLPLRFALESARDRAG